MSKGKNDYSPGDKVDAADLNQIADNANDGDFITDIDSGEAIDGSTTPVALYLKGTDGKMYKSDASGRNEESEFFGMTKSDVAIDTELFVQKDGQITIPSETLTEVVSSTRDQYQDQTGTSTLVFDTTDSRISQTIRIGDQVGNISSVRFYINDNGGTGTNTFEVQIFAADADGKPTGSVLATSNSVSTASGDQEETFTFATPYDVNPGEIYCLVILATSKKVNDPTASATDQTDTAYNVVAPGFDDGFVASTYYSTNAGSSWSAPGKSVYFKTYFTQKQFLYGDPVFLSETAGEYTLTRPVTADSNVVKIGKLLSQTKMLIDSASENKFLGSSEAVVDVNDQKVTIGVPPRTHRAVVFISTVYGSGDTGLQGELVKGSLESVKLSGLIDAVGGNYGATISFQDGVIEAQFDTNVSSDLTLTVHFYTY